MLFSLDVAVLDVLFLIGIFDIRVNNHLLWFFGVTVAISSHFCFLVAIYIHQHIFNAFILFRVLGSGLFYHKLFFSIFFSLCFFLALANLGSFGSFSENFLKVTLIFLVFGALHFHRC